MRVLALALLLLTFSLAAHAQSENRPHAGRRPYVGLGWKGLFNDESSFVLNGRATVGPYFSLRPDLIFNRRYVTPQVALTVDGRLTRWWWIYAGGGGAYNNDGDGKVQPYVSAGTDINLPLRLTVRFGGQILFRKGDTDAGGLVTFNFRF